MGPGPAALPAGVRGAHRQRLGARGAARPRPRVLWRPRPLRVQARAPRARVARAPLRMRRRLVARRCMAGPAAELATALEPSCWLDLDAVAVSSVVAPRDVTRHKEHAGLASERVPDLHVALHAAGLSQQAEQLTRQCCACGCSPCVRHCSPLFGQHSMSHARPPLPPPTPARRAAGRSWPRARASCC